MDHVLRHNLTDSLTIISCAEYLSHTEFDIQGGIKTRKYLYCTKNDLIADTFLQTTIVAKSLVDSCQRKPKCYPFGFLALCWFQNPSPHVNVVVFHYHNVCDLILLSISSNNIGIGGGGLCSENLGLVYRPITFGHDCSCSLSQK